jgi:hypothetical protein
VKKKQKLVYDPEAKFTQPTDGVIVLGAGPTNNEIAEADARIRQGEDAQKVYDEINARVAERERIRRYGIAAQVGNQI